MNRQLIAPVPARLLLALAVLLTFPAALAVWQERVLMDEQRFVATGNDVLQEPAVQREIARSISDEIANARDTTLESGISQLLGGSSRDLTNILNALGGTPAASADDTDAGTRSLVDSVALKLIEGTPNTSEADAALALTRREVLIAFREGFLRAEDDRIILDLNDALAELLPVGAANIPSELGEVEVMRRSDLVFTFRLARWFDGRALLLALLPVALFACGFFLAPSWPRYALQAGVSLIAAAAVWIVLVKLPLKWHVVEQTINQERARPAANAAYDVITTSLVHELLILGIVGLVVAAVGFVLSRQRVPGDEPEDSSRAGAV